MKTVFGKKKSRVNRQTLGRVSPSHISILASVYYIGLNLGVETIDTYMYLLY